MKHLMIDFETLSTRPNAVILSLGAVVFDKDQHLEKKIWIFDIKTQMQVARAVDADTIAWWMEQGEDAKSVFKKCISEGKLASQICTEFNEMVRKHGDLVVWSNGASFDVPIMENLLTSLRLPIPWKFWNIRCYRTVKKLGIETEKQKGTKHDALQDAIYQANNVMRLFQMEPKYD